MCVRAAGAAAGAAGLGLGCQPTLPTLESRDASIIVRGKSVYVLRFLYPPTRFPYAALCLVDLAEFLRGHVGRRTITSVRPAAVIV